MTYGGTIAGRWSGSLVGRRRPQRFNSFEFDTGLGKSLRATVQDGVIELLARLDRANGGYLGAIEPGTAAIRGVDDDQGIALAYEVLKGRAPAILVVVGDQPFAPKGDVDRWDGTLDVHLYVLVNSLRSRTARQAGDVVSLADPSADPGAFVILEHCQQLLFGVKPGGNGTVIRELRPVIERRIDGDRDNELWEQSYTVVCGRAINSKRDIDRELKVIETKSRLSVQLATDPAIVETTTVIK